MCVGGGGGGGGAALVGGFPLAKNDFSILFRQPGVRGPAALVGGPGVLSPRPKMILALS